MNWDAIGAIGELLGSTAVLVTLIAIWFQMRQSAKMERATAQRDVLDRVTQFAKGLNDNGHCDTELARGFADQPDQTGGVAENGFVSRGRTPIFDVPAH